MLSLHKSTAKNLGKMVETKKVSTEFKTHIDVEVMEKSKTAYKQTVRMAKYYIDKSKCTKFPLISVPFTINPSSGQCLNL